MSYKYSVRDESFIISWGGRLFSGGVRNFFGDVLGGVENKITYGQGGSCILSGIGRVRCVPLVFLFINRIASGGGVAPRPPYIPAL